MRGENHSLSNAGVMQRHLVCLLGEPMELANNLYSGEEPRHGVQGFYEIAANPEFEDGYRLIGSER